MPVSSEVVSSEQEARTWDFVLDLADSLLEKYPPSTDGSENQLEVHAAVHLRAMHRALYQPCLSTSRSVLDDDIRTIQSLSGLSFRSYCEALSAAIDKATEEEV